MAYVSPPVTDRLRSNALRAFRSLDYRRFLGSRLISILGLEMVNVAVGWQVYALTRRPLDLGYVGLAQFVPALALSVPAGQLADRFDRARVVAVCDLVLAGCALGLSRASSVTSIYGILVVAGSARAF